MSADLLLHWMTHLGEGSWPAFKRSVHQISPDDSDPAGLARSLRINFSDCGHANFFIEGSQKWRVTAPMLAGLAADASDAVLCGGRTPALINSLQQTVHTANCDFSINDQPLGASRVFISGPQPAIKSVAAGMGLEYMDRASVQLLGEVKSIGDQLSSSPFAIPRFNWEASSFDLKTLTWVSGVLPNSACQFQPAYGNPEFLLHKKHRRFVALSKRQAVYASAMLRGVQIVIYDEVGQCLSVPIAAPLPENLARIAVLSSGDLPELRGGSLAYRSIPADVGYGILIALGQPNSMPSHLVRRSNLG